MNLIAFLIGFALIIAGIAFIYWPLALIAVGFTLCFASVRLSFSFEEKLSKTAVSPADFNNN